MRYKIHSTNEDKNGKKQTRATVKRSFFNLVFLDCLNNGKDYYKALQFALNPPTENDIFSFELALFP